ncbi:transmembrane protein 179B [Brachionichthys hirsutus]|uniref:transmembrane protein 179B n=1 Tax=Brachionichthys hirsutus TaxID=412623 RepID=UPI003605292E
MALAGLLLLLELCLYAGCFVCGIVTAATTTIVQGRFGGRCLLYGLVSYNSTGGAIELATAGASSLCYFVSSTSVLVAVACFSLSLYWLYTFCIEEQIAREPVWLNVMLGLSGVFLFFLLITGCMLKIGRDTLCKSIVSAVPNVTSCEEAESRLWVSPLNGQQFYSNLYKAEVAAWINFFFWVVAALLVFFQKRRAAGRHARPSEALFGDAGATAEETEPFFNRPARPQ